MGNNVNPLGQITPVGNSSGYSRVEEQIAESEKFAKVLERFDAAQETAEERRARLKREDELALERKTRQKKMADLQRLIAELQSKLMQLGGSDPETEARISAAQTQLFWLRFGF